jgi:hypothetical protein
MALIEAYHAVLDNGAVHTVIAVYYMATVLALN